MTTSETVERAITVRTVAGAQRRRRLGVVMVTTLLAQAVLGVANELWTHVPSSGDPVTSAVPLWLLTAHVMLGTIVVVLAVVLAVSALRGHDRTWGVPATGGLLASAGAWLSGHLFLVTYGQDAASLSMAACCMLAIGSYVGGLVRFARV